MKEQTPFKGGSLSNIELRVINALLSKFNESVPASDLTPTEPEFTGVGCYVHFRPESQSKRLAHRSGFMAGIGFECEELVHPIGCMLHVQEGLLKCLECYTHAGEDWPASFSNVRIIEIAPAT